MRDSLKGILPILFFLLSGCSYMSMDNPFHNDPLTGGVNISQSGLLTVPIPPGFQVYPSHGYSRTGVTGAREGLETYRGNVDAQTAAQALFNTLKSAGWQMRLALRKGDRSLYLYQKGNERAVIAFRRQGMLTILEIWSGPALADDSGFFPAEGVDEGPDIAIQGEEYGPDNGGKDRVVETWGGGSGLEEREL